MSTGDNGEGFVDSFDESTDLDDEDVVVLIDEDDLERRCAVLAVADIDGQEYALLAPIDQLQDEQGNELELFIFQYALNEDEVETFASVDDETIYTRVRDFFASLMEHEVEEED